MNDLISRQDAIDALDVGAELLRRVLDDADVVGVERKKYEWGLGLIESYISDMKELPSAQPERKRGHWEIYVISMFDGEGCRCSECGSEGAPHWVSCPNCDARMEGVKNETD